MDCREVIDENVTERHVRGELNAQEQEAFERHFFTCARCFEELRTFEALQAELKTMAAAAGRPSGAPAATLAAGLSLAATVVVIVGAGLWLRQPTRATKQQPAPAATSSKAADSPASAPEVSLTELARFDPPRYKAPVLRTPEDEARPLFNDAMNHYGKKEYSHAIDGLRAATSRDPQATDARFFLGVCLLLQNKTDEGIAELKGTIAIGDSAYREDAQYYLAKGLLQRGDPQAARATLRALIALKGDRQRDATQLLSMIESAGVGRR
jgi:TolA-binding protein